MFISFPIWNHSIRYGGDLGIQLHHPISDRLSIPCHAAMWGSNPMSHIGLGHSKVSRCRMGAMDGHGAIEIPKYHNVHWRLTWKSQQREPWTLPPWISASKSPRRCHLGISGLHPWNISNHVFPTCDSRFPTEAAMDAAYQLLPRSVFWGPKNQNHNFKTYHLVI